VNEGLHKNTWVPPNEEHNPYFTGFPERPDREICSSEVLVLGLKELDLSFNSIGNQGIEILATYMKCDYNTLVKLDVSNCKILTKGAITFLLAMGQQHTLQELNLSNNDINILSAANRDHTLKFPELLCNALEASICISLICLKLENCGLGDTEFTAIGQSLKHVNFLRQLYMKQNKITSLGMSSFCNQINTSTSRLEHVDISENKINDDCERELADAIRSKSLKRMILTGN
jgi:Ran GTPase-activating protein (RanGAP) involved in mRNA processing and transport